MTQRADHLRQAIEAHTPWARAIFAEERLWLACYCGWNANRDGAGTWNEHFHAVLAEAAA